MPPSPTRSRLSAFFWGQIALGLALKTAYFATGSTRSALFTGGAILCISGFVGARLYAGEKARLASPRAASSDKNEPRSPSP